MLQSVDSQVSLAGVSQSDSASSTQSLTHGGVPELLVGLSYNATTGRLSVELIKGSHFRNLAINRPPGEQTPSHTPMFTIIRTDYQIGRAIAKFQFAT